VDKDGARAEISKALKQKREMLRVDEAVHILECYRIPTPLTRACSNLHECISAAKEIGYPVALKIDSVDVIHKTEAGGISLNISDEKELKEEFNKMRGKFENASVQFVVQDYLTDGVEVIVGARAVAGVGHVVMFGAGGVMVEVLKDVVFSFAPVSRPAAERMVRSVRSFPLLDGFRGGETVNIDRLSEMLVRVSQLVHDVPEIQELDLNPIIAYQDPSRTVSVDVRVRLLSPPA
jgi:acetyltransferase